VARVRNLKPFYLGLAVVAVAGAGWIWMAAKGGSGAPISAPVDEAAVARAAGFPGYSLGSPDAPVTVIEYADFQCPACAQFAILTMHDVKQRLIAAGRVRWQFRDFPLPGHRHSRLAHHAAACAGEQGRFWEMHDQLFYGQSTWSAERNPYGRFRDYARAVGLDLARYDECMESARYSARIEASVRDGEQLGVSSTPTFIIGNRRYPGFMTYDALRALIDSVAAASSNR
jgi:protein-disulfide isomerase